MQEPEIEEDFKQFRPRYAKKMKKKGSGPGRMRHRNAVQRTEGEAQTRERALATLALMRRESLSLKTAADTVGIDPRTVLRYVGSALQLEPGGDYHPTPHDRIPRTLHFITPRGPVAVTVRDSRTASRIAEYMNAVRTCIHTGDPSA